MNDFDRNRKRIGETEFIKDPLAFIRFLREDDEKLVEFGQTALTAAGEEVITPLLALLSDEREDKKVRMRAGNVLSRIGKPAIVPLIEALKDQDLKTKTSAVTIGLAAAALGGIGKEAVNPLIGELRSGWRQVRFGAAIALMQTGDTAAINAVREAAANGEPGDREMFNFVLSQK